MGEEGSVKDMGMNVFSISRQSVNQINIHLRPCHISWMKWVYCVSRGLRHLWWWLCVVQQSNNVQWTLCYVLVVLLSTSFRREFKFPTFANSFLPLNAFDLLRWFSCRYRMYRGNRLIKISSSYFHHKTLLSNCIGGTLPTTFPIMVSIVNKKLEGQDEWFLVWYY